MAHPNGTARPHPFAGHMGVCALLALSACVPADPDAPRPRTPADGPAITNMDVTLSPRADGTLEVLNTITYDPTRMTRAELVATFPGLCNDYGNLRVGSVADAPAQLPETRVIILQCR